LSLSGIVFSPVHLRGRPTALKERLEAGGYWRGGFKIFV
jgi:hypothetical protein